MCLSYLKWSNSNIFFSTISLLGVFTNRDLWRRDMACKQAVISSLQLHQQSFPKVFLITLGGVIPSVPSSYTWLYMRLRCLGQVWGLIVRFPLFTFHMSAEIGLSDILLSATTFCTNCSANTGDSSGHGWQAGSLLSCHPWEEDTAALWHQLVQRRLPVVRY